MLLTPSSGLFFGSILVDIGLARDLYRVRIVKDGSPQLFPEESIKTHNAVLPGEYPASDIATNNPHLDPAPPAQHGLHERGPAPSFGEIEQLVENARGHGEQHLEELANSNAANSSGFTALALTDCNWALEDKRKNPPHYPAELRDLFGHLNLSMPPTVAEIDLENPSVHVKQTKSGVTSYPWPGCPAHYEYWRTTIHYRVAFNLQLNVLTSFSQARQSESGSKVPRDKWPPLHQYFDVLSVLWAEQVKAEGMHQGHRLKFWIDHKITDTTTKRVMLGVARRTSMEFEILSSLPPGLSADFAADTPAGLALLGTPRGALVTKALTGYPHNFGGQLTVQSITMFATQPVADTHRHFHLAFRLELVRPPSLIPLLDNPDTFEAPPILEDPNDYGFGPLLDYLNDHSTSDHPANLGPEILPDAGVELLDLTGDELLDADPAEETYNDVDIDAGVPGAYYSGSDADADGETDPDYAGSNADVHD